MMKTTQIMTEADTCRELVTPKPVDAPWGNTTHVIGEQYTFTNGRDSRARHIPSRAVQRTFKALQPTVTALKASHTPIRQASDTLILATLERVFGEARTQRATM